MEEVQVEPPQKMEVRIKILFSSICHSDLTAGVVESVGEGVEDLKSGDRVIPIFNGECAHCRSHATNLCARFRVDAFKSVMAGDGRTRFSVIDRAGERRPVSNFLNTSTFSEFTVLDSSSPWITYLGSAILFG